MKDSIKEYIKHKREQEKKNKPVPIKGTLTEEQFIKIAQRMGLDTDSIGGKNK